MMNDTAGPPQQDGATCPKRVWVMLTLSDDEALEEGGRLPSGLQFHLSQCESCRALADSLLAASGTLHAMSLLEPGAELGRRADSQAVTALSEGGTLTGRVTIVDEPDLVSTKPARARLYRLTRYAAAAAVFIAVGLVGLSVLRRPSEPLATRKPALPRSRIAAPPVASDPVEPTRVETEPEERLAQTSPAESDTTGPIRDRKPRRTRRYRSHVEAAMCEDPNYVHRAVILPPPGHRDLGWGNRLFDRPRATVSTVPHHNDE